MDVILDVMKPPDWDQVQAIYRQGIATGQATFETEAPSWEQWDASHHPFARLVARSGERIVGWAALSPVSSRCVYAGVAEVSIYVAASARGQGLGRILLQATVASSEEAGIWTLQAGVFPENTPSLALLARCGFRGAARTHRPPLSLPVPVRQPSLFLSAGGILYAAFTQLLR